MPSEDENSLVLQHRHLVHREGRWLLPSLRANRSRLFLQADEGQMSEEKDNREVPSRPVIRPRWTCLRCGHVWIGSKQTPPVLCVKCRNPYWARPRKRPRRLFYTKAQIELLKQAVQIGLEEHQKAHKSVFEGTSDEDSDCICDNCTLMKKALGLPTGAH